MQPHPRGRQPHAGMGGGRLLGIRPVPARRHAPGVTEIAPAGVPAPHRAHPDEGARLLAAVPAGSHVIALSAPAARSTRELAAELEFRLGQGRDLALLIGDPEGLSGECLRRADQPGRVAPDPGPSVVRVLASSSTGRGVSFIVCRITARNGSWFPARRPNAKLAAGSVATALSETARSARGNASCVIICARCRESIARTRRQPGNQKPQTRDQKPRFMIYLASASPRRRTAAPARAGSRCCPRTCWRCRSGRDSARLRAARGRRQGAVRRRL